MRLVKSKDGQYRFTASPSDSSSDILQFLSRHHKQVNEFPVPDDLIVDGSPSLARDAIARILTAVYQVMVYLSAETSSYFPQDVEDSSNFYHDTYANWGEVPCYRRYVNHRMRIIADPEFLLIYWSKGFENFDVNNNALLPAYPKSVTNIYFTPAEIRHVCELMLFEWTVHGCRNDPVPLSDRKKALTRFKTSFPLLYDLVFTADGFRILETIHAITSLTDKDDVQSKETRQKCRTLFRDMLEAIKEQPLKTHMRTHDKIAVHFMGMPNPRVLSNCILTMFFTYAFFYLPADNIYDLHASVLDYCRRVTARYDMLYPTEIYREDYDPGKKALVLSPVTFRFYRKIYVDRINTFFKKPNYSNFFLTLTPRLLCMLSSDRIL